MRLRWVTRSYEKHQPPDEVWLDNLGNPTLVVKVEYQVLQCLNTDEMNPKNGKYGVWVDIITEEEE